ncbi:glutathione transferase [Sphingobium sp. 22B]|uniref:fosfomycin resistance glutathione transferase n=1 Tax=unclassified Sphingobium TaxID=2611147 RepID=UPI0007855345|nr:MULTISPECIES: fosfomycin resistance glutathione transferase [unclassified Sphingobium]KXU33856.1 glutathione transferase [Sphingobium sp. AM]KYC33801.1 glutathione transferase [Sphingobium sp. 22B]OAP33535.1 glutathione transferase [Sphingobium sp. 20006FA]
MSLTNPGKVRGLNHLTLAVVDIGRSIAFYRDLLGFSLRAQWDEGAYVEAGTLWLCLSLDASRAGPQPDYTHIALDVEENEFAALSERISNEAVIWKSNRSEGNSLYFLDPDGHKLELHVGSLESRLAHYEAHPVPGRTIY